MTAAQLAAANLVIGLGSLLQGSIGFGSALLAAPLFALIDPSLAPGPLIVCNIALTALMSGREWRAVRYRDLGWSLGGRIVGIVIVLAIMGNLTVRGLDFLFGGLVLVGVLITAFGPSFTLNPPTLVGAGIASGIMGTATAIGGPPMAIIYQKEKGPQFRGTLSAYFTIGAVLSGIGLWWGGRFGWAELGIGLLLCPGVVLGFLGSSRFIGLVDRKGVRPAVLLVSALSAIVLILRHFV